MIDYSKLKTKKQKWLEVALFFAVVLVFIAFLAYFGLQGNSDTITPIDGNVTYIAENGDSVNRWWFIPHLFVLGLIAIIIWLFSTRGNKPIPSMIDTDIIKIVADQIHNEEENLLLSTRLINVKTQRSEPDEWYIEFINEAITFVFRQGTGVVERHIGMSIDNINEKKANDKIRMKLAEIGIARKRHLDIMEREGLTNEEMV